MRIARLAILILAWQASLMPAGAAPKAKTQRAPACRCCCKALGVCNCGCRQRASQKEQTPPSDSENRLCVCGDTSTPIVVSPVRLTVDRQTVVGVCENVTLGAAGQAHAHGRMRTHGPPPEQPTLSTTILLL